MEAELDTLRRANAELQAWVRDLLEENRHLRSEVAQGDDRSLPEPVRPQSAQADRSAA